MEFAIAGKCFKPYTGIMKKILTKFCINTCWVKEFYSGDGVP